MFNVPLVQFHQGCLNSKVVQIWCRGDPALYSPPFGATWCKFIWLDRLAFHSMFIVVQICLKPYCEGMFVIDACPNTVLAWDCKAHRLAYILIACVCRLQLSYQHHLRAMERFIHGYCSTVSIWNTCGAHFIQRFKSTEFDERLRNV